MAQTIDLAGSAEARENSMIISAKLSNGIFQKRQAVIFG